MAMAQLETAEVLQMGMPLFYAAVIIFCFDNWKNIPSFTRFCHIHAISCTRCGIVRCFSMLYYGASD